MTEQKKWLNLYGGVGGNVKKWPSNIKVTTIENDVNIAALYQKLNPTHEVIVTDAHDYLRKHYKEYYGVWGSPPCQKHSRMMKATRHDVADYPDLKLYEEIIFLDNFFKGPWIIENVVPYYKPLIEPKIRIGRHLFWSSHDLFGITDVKRPSGFINKATLEGKKQMQDWLGIHFEETIYYKNNHCPVQILRNCVHPDLGLQLYNAINQ